MDNNAALSPPALLTVRGLECEETELALNALRLAGSSRIFADNATGGCCLDLTVMEIKKRKHPVEANNDSALNVMRLTHRHM